MATLEIIGSGSVPWTEVDWNRAYKRFHAAVGLANLRLLQTLVNDYPNAKVIHTTRDPVKWYESAKNTVYKYNQTTDDGMPDHVKAAYPMIDTVVWGGDLQGKFEDKEEVKRTVPADKLLIFETGVDGWEKLCRFLGKEVPDKPWPHLNQRETFAISYEHIFNGAKPTQFTILKS
ncbi:hypothetical protein BGW37DRAFT_470233 [Umbelopsis sp. PMI_123]|nr:hypothetical protein BGW37DRAFT_470233 [Umbelopsis sp. PMI_123]